MIITDYSMMARFHILALLALVLAGCSDNSQPAAEPAGDKKTDKVAGEAAGEKPVRSRVVISVNGRELLSTNLDERVEMLVKVSTIANPNMALSDIPKLRKRLRSSLQNMFVREVVFDDFAKAENIKVDKESVEKAKKGLLAGFRGRMTYEGLRRKVGPLAAALDDFVRVQATEVAVRQHILAKNPLNLPPNYAEEQIKRIKAYNAEMAITNAAVYARATNAWEKLKAGADFREIARQFSEVAREAKEGGDWGTLGFQQLEPDEDLAAWVQKLQPGGFSPPIEGDNGLMILRVDSKKGDDYKLSRVYFRLPMFQELVGEKELLNMKRQQHEQAVLRKEIGELLKTAKVVRPKSKKKAKKAKSKKKSAVSKAQPRSNAAKAKQQEGGKRKADLGGKTKNETEKESKGNTK